MAQHNVAALERAHCQFYESEHDDDIRTTIDDEDHFSDTAYRVAQSLGYVNPELSEVQNSFYEDDWTESDCDALGKKLVWLLDEEKSNMEYVVHIIVEAPNWSLGTDNREDKQKKKMALCVTGDSGDESVYSQIHEVGKCPECLYEHEITIDKKVKITATVYIRVTGKDRKQKFQGLFDDALSEVFHRSAIEDNLHDAMYYEMDDEVEVKANVKSLKQTSVPRTKEI